MNNKCILKFKQEFIQRKKNHFIQHYFIYRYKFQQKKSGGPIPTQFSTSTCKRQEAKSWSLHFLVPPLDPLPGRMVSFSGLSGCSEGIREEGEGGATGAISGSSSVAVIFFPLLFDVPCFFLLFEEDSLPGVARAERRGT